MCGPDFGPPPIFEYVDLGQYSDEEIHDYIKHLCEFMNNRNKHKQELGADIGDNSMKIQKESHINVEDIPF